MDNQEISDRLEIQDLVAAFADAVNRRNPRLVSARCHPDVTFTVPGWADLQGVEPMVQFLSQILGHWEVILHSITSGHVSVDGDAATGGWYITEYGRRDGDEVYLAGLYRDDYVRMDGRWLFKGRSFQSMFYRSRPAGPELDVHVPLPQVGDTSGVP